MTARSHRPAVALRHTWDGPEIDLPCTLPRSQYRRPAAQRADTGVLAGRGTRQVNRQSVRHRHQHAQPAQPRVAVTVTLGHATTVTHERPPAAQDTKPEAHQGDVPTSRTDTQNVFLCRRQSGPLEHTLGLPGSATTYTGRYTTLRPSGKLHPQAVGGTDGRYGGSPEVQTVTCAVPPICAGLGSRPMTTQATQIWALFASTSRGRA
jgi:hypothetical protein